MAAKLFDVEYDHCVVSRLIVAADNPALEPRTAPTPARNRCWTGRADTAVAIPRSGSGPTRSAAGDHRVRADGRKGLVSSTCFTTDQSVPAMDGLQHSDLLYPSPSWGGAPWRSRDEPYLPNAFLNTLSSAGGLHEEMQALMRSPASPRGEIALSASSLCQRGVVRAVGDIRRHLACLTYAQDHQPPP